MQYTGSKEHKITPGRTRKWTVNGRGGGDLLLLLGLLQFLLGNVNHWQLVAKPSSTFLPQLQEGVWGG